MLGLANLRPCEHQVAGHLFEEGKAGSLVDDRGHFYKPIQQGPRGDRERDFYEAVAAALAAEERELDDEEQQRQQKAAAELNGSGDAAAPAVAAHPRSLPLPVRTKLSSVPSFRERDRTAVQIAQRDEWGLLGTPTLRDLRCGADDAWLGRSPDSDGAELTAEHLMEGFQQRRTPPHRQPSPLGARLISAAAAADGGGHQQQQQGDQAVRRPPGEDGPSARSPPAALTDPRHAEVAAMLGQPIFDVELSQPLPPPYRHACSPRSLREAQGDGAAAAAAAAGATSESGAAAPPLPPAVAAAAAAVRELGSAGHERSPPGTPPVIGPRQTASASYEHDRDLLFVRQALGSASAGAELAAVLGAAGIPNGSALAAEGSTAAAPAPLADSQQQQRPAEGHCGLGSGPRPKPDVLVLDSGKAVVAAGPFSAFSPCGSGGDPRLWLLVGEEEQQQEQQQQEGGGDKGAHRLTGFARLPFSVRNALLLDVIPKFYGVVEAEGRTLLELEDLTRNYRRPSIIDIKVGFRTWYPSATQDYIERCQAKDRSTTQASLGFKICGMQVYRHSQGGYWRASKRWCKTLPAGLVDKALLSFAHNESGVRPEHVYSGARGAIAQLQSLETWFEMQREFHFYSSSILILYEGGAVSGEDARVRVRLVDFAHTFQLEPSQCQRDHNFLAGLRAIIARLSAVTRAELADSLA